MGMMIGQLVLHGVSISSLAELTTYFFVQTTAISQIMPETVLGSGFHLWFLSSAVFAGSICVYFWSDYGERANIFFFAGAVLLYNYLINTFGSLDAWSKPVFSGAVAWPALCWEVYCGTSSPDLINWR